MPKTKLDPKTDSPSSTPLPTLDTSFDFEQWATLVRRQLMASLQKRGMSN